MSTYLNADKIYAELISAGDRWAEADEQARNLEDTKAVLLAQLTLTAQQNIKSRVEAETCAMASKEYQNHIAGMNEARKIANKAKVRWIAVQNLAELRRSQESTRRQEMRLV